MSQAVQHDDALRALAERCGIDCELADADGSSRPVAPRTLAALLNALGWPAANEQQVTAAAAAIDAADLRPLPPVIVAKQTAPILVAVRLPKRTRELRWSIVLENGDEQTGEVDFQDLLLGGPGTPDSERRMLPLSALPLGYHRLKIDSDGGTADLIVVPERCWLPPAPERKYWGVAAQLYLLRSQSDWGIGDFTALKCLFDLVSFRKGDVVGVNPLHAAFPDDPQHCSPYSPASRLLLNVLNIDVEAVPGYHDSDAVRTLVAADEFQSRLASCRAADLVDYPGVARLKEEVLETLFAEARASNGEPWGRFMQFRDRLSATFERHCVHLALRRFLQREDDNRADWRGWPGMLHDCDSAEVAAFSEDRADEVSYVAWLQWLADDQLRSAIARGDGMEVGLYRDLAVGADANGAETWSAPQLFATGVHIGAPPDLLSAAGQDWGLPPWSPAAMRRDGYRSFSELVRANMRYAGALRIDHAMALQRLFWVPEGAKPNEGAYVRYPLEDLLGILALESTRAQCIVIGEDLGIVPAGFRARMTAANVLSYRILLFERDGDTQFVAPEDYPRSALAVTGNHDLPTLRGWWEEHDIALQQRFNHLPEEQAAERRRRRSAERGALVAAFQRESLLSVAESDPSFEAVAGAAHRYIGRTNAMIALTQADDLSGEADPVNVPDASRYPSWRRRLHLPLEDIAGERVITTALAEGRTAIQ